MSTDFNHYTKLGDQGRMFLLFGLGVEATYLFAEAVGGYYSIGYNYFDNTASQLMAIGSDDRFFFTPFYFFHSLMIGLFGYGLVQQFEKSDFQRLYAGGLLLINVGICYALACTLFPMDPPETSYSLSGYLHVAFVSTGVLSLCIAIPIIGKSGAQLMHWPWFKNFSFFVQPIVLIAGLASPIILYNDLAMMGFAERIIGHASSIWIFVLAYGLMKHFNQESISKVNKKHYINSYQQSENNTSFMKSTIHPKTDHEKTNSKTNTRRH